MKIQLHQRWYPTISCRFGQSTTLILSRNSNRWWKPLLSSIWTRRSNLHWHCLRWVMMILSLCLRYETKTFSWRRNNNQSRQTGLHRWTSRRKSKQRRSIGMDLPKSRRFSLALKWFLCSKRKRKKLQRSSTSFVLSRPSCSSWNKIQGLAIRNNGLCSH